MKGFGAVVTGTLASGEISEGDELELLPTGTKVRVRGIQSHGKKVQKVTSGRRVAVNLGGIDHADVARGMTLVEPNTLDATQAFDAEVEVLAAAPRSLRSRQRVRVHIGTAEALARVQVLNETAEIGQGETDLVQLRFETPIVAVPGERFILRSYSPQMTIAGGVVIDNSPQRHRRRDLAVIRTALSTSRGELGGPQAMVEHLVAAADASGTTFAELQARTALKKAVLDVAIAHAKEKGSVVELDRRYLAGLNFQQLAAAMDDAVAVFHKKEPLAKGIPREILRERVFAFLPDEIFEGVLAAAAAKGTITLDKETIRLTTHSAELSPEESAVSDKISSIYANARLEVPKVEDVLAVAVAGTTLSNGNAKKLLQKAIDAGKIVRVSDEFCFSKQAIEHLREKLKAFADTTPDRLIDVPKFKEIAGVSRKYAIPLLEYFDRVHMTARAGDKRVIL
jgi:selenocysteine-specific elongation factor